MEKLILLTLFITFSTFVICKKEGFTHKKRATPLMDQWVHIVNKANNLCLDVNQNKKGAQYPCSKNVNSQKWKITKVSNNKFTFTNNAYPTLRLANYDWNLDLDTKDSDSRYWRIDYKSTANNKDYYQFSCYYRNKVIDVPSASTDVGKELTVWDSNDGSNQLFALLKMGEPVNDFWGVVREDFERTNNEWWDSDAKHGDCSKRCNQKGGAPCQLRAHYYGCCQQGAGMCWLNKSDFSYTSYYCSLPLYVKGCSKGNTVVINQSDCNSQCSAVGGKSCGKIKNCCRNCSNYFNGGSICDSEAEIDGCQKNNYF